MPIDGETYRRVAWLEAFLLFLNTPFLLFPTTFPIVTAVALLLLVGGWLVCWRLVAFPLRSTPFNVAFLAFACMLLVGILVSADPDLTLPKATGMILALAAWRYLSFYMQSQRLIWLAFLVFAVVGLGMIGLGVLSADWRFRVGFVEALFQRLPPQLVNLPGTTEAGVHTNQLSGTLLFYITLPLAFLLDRTEFHSKRVILLSSLAALLVLGALLLLTQSRSAWMGTVGGVGFLLFAWLFLKTENQARRRLLWLGLLASLLVVALLLVLLWPTLVAALYVDLPESTPIGTLQTLRFRYEIWRWAVPAIGDFPFTGTGLGTFRRVVSRLYPIYYSTDIAHAHNVFLQVALDVGLPGLVSYLSILYIAFFGAYRVAKSDLQLRPLVLGLISGLVAFHGYGLTDALALGSKSAIALWLAVGILSAAWLTVEPRSCGFSRSSAEAVTMNNERAVRLQNNQYGTENTT